jgi:hypothetical protein
MAESEPLPRTIEAAVELVLSHMSEPAKTFLREFDGDETALAVRLATVGLTAGMNVRALLGLWGRNSELLAQLPARWRHPDSASIFFLIECWRWLRGKPSYPPRSDS